METEVIKANYKYIYLIPDFEGTQISMPNGKTLTRPNGYTWCEENPFCKGDDGYEDVVCYRKVGKSKKKDDEVAVKMEDLIRWHKELSCYTLEQSKYAVMLDINKYLGNETRINDDMNFME